MMTPIVRQDMNLFGVAAVRTAKQQPRSRTTSAGSGGNNTNAKSANDRLRAQSTSVIYDTKQSSKSPSCQSKWSSSDDQLAKVNSVKKEKSQKTAQLHAQHRHQHSLAAQMSTLEGIAEG